MNSPISDKNHTVFPLCGLTLADCLSVSGVNQKQAAKKLGVDYSHFNRMVRRLGLAHLFPPTRPRCISREDVIEAAKGCRCQLDAAEALGISGPYLSQLVAMWGLRGMFPDRREAQLRVMRAGN